MYVDSAACQSTQVIAADPVNLPWCAALMTCTLPEGSGKGRPLSVNSNGQFSAPIKLVSYAIPNITRLEGECD